jgi:hypothetical protein
MDARALLDPAAQPRRPPASGDRLFAALRSIPAFALLSLTQAPLLASPSPLARCVSACIALHWWIRLVLQAVFAVAPYLDRAWMRAGYNALSALFLALTMVYAAAALQ